MRKAISEINVTSLVDVTMVLLIIFMIAAPLFRSGIEIELPKSKSDDLKPQQGIIVTITNNDLIYIDEDKVKIENFENSLLKKYAANTTKIVMIQADKIIPYGKVVNVMDRIKGLGIRNIGLIVETDKK